VSIQYKNAKKYLRNTFIATLLVLVSGIVFAEETAKISAISGYVTVTSSDGEVRRLKDGDTIKEGDVINTGEDSTVTITLANGEIVNLGSSVVYNFGQASSETEGAFAKRSFTTGSPVLSTATSSGGGINDNTPTTPGIGGSPTN